MDGAIELTVSGSDERATVEAGLQAVLNLVRDGVGHSPAPTGGQTTGESAVPIRGQGGELAALVVDLANDLLAQLDTHGFGLTDVRFDGLLRTDQGYSGWGYLLGETGDTPPPRTVTLVGSPTIERSAEGLTFHLRLAIS
jgi:hypothetical protein